ncbi:anti-sigma-F factor Fin [Salsuginibacillus kocurii]|uniref:anti-sigma-F factor Fin n=1 Tax=Salsuginibacillus kocurii TaxID=427078 RepID=UPI000365EA11|nr:anti-sigma-F factor Fin [Salsuginibacillus kocurii]
MTVQYVCRHCQSEIGNVLKEQVTDHDLGFTQLTEDEKQQMIQNEQDGAKKVQVICEHCYEAQQRNPALHELDYWIH